MAESTGEIPIVCNLDALTPDERARRTELASRLGAHTEATEESAEGFRMRLASCPEVPRDALEFALLERRCCPFLRFQLEIEPGSQDVWLHLSGGPGVKRFLAETGICGSGPPRPECC